MKADKLPEEQREESETKSSTRVNPDHVFDPVADKIEFKEKGKWTYKVYDHLYSDVLRAAYLEGFIVTEIENCGDGTINIEVTEIG
jgi:hypothetical protein